MELLPDLIKLDAALTDLVNSLAGPRRDAALRRQTDVDIDIDLALAPLVTALDARDRLCVADLSALVGRDHTTVSRQLAKLETLGLVTRPKPGTDDRRRDAALTPAGRDLAAALATARLRLLDNLLADWSETEIAALAQLNRRFADAVLPRLPMRR